MERFEGKVAVVTGAAGGIGRAAAQRFAEEGASVVLVDLPGAPIEEAAAAVEHAGGKAHIVRADVTRAAEVDGYVQAATERFDRIDVFFNNAGILGPVSSLLDYPEEAFDRVLAVNVKGIWLGMRAVGRAMVAQGSGAIVNTASVAGLGGTPTLFAYGASKHAVVGMTKSAAITLGPHGVRVNAICPALIETPMAEELARGTDPDNPEAIRARFQDDPLGRIGQPREVAALVAYLCSDEASFTTGGIYTIDGGRRAR